MADLICAGLVTRYFPVARGVDADIRSIRMTYWQPPPGPWTPEGIPLLKREVLYKPGSRNLLATASDGGRGCDLSGATVSTNTSNQATTAGYGFFAPQYFGVYAHIKCLAR